MNLAAVYDAQGQYTEAVQLYRRALVLQEQIVGPDHPLRDKFARLTAQEEKHGLLDDASGIGTREGWARRLSERGFSLKGHRLVRSSGQARRDKDPACEQADGSTALSPGP